jgi:3-methyl-2-oxobutanoate hydroxymethyltransferase
MNVNETQPPRMTLATLREMKAAGRKIALLTAYDYPTAVLAQAAGVHGLLVGDSLATVLLGHASTQAAPLDLMVTLAEAVRRGAPHVFLIGDMPYQAVQPGHASALDAARRFCQDAGCDAVKFEASVDDAPLVEALAAAGYTTITHLGLRPQQVTTPDGYRAQARDPETISDLVATSQRMVAAGAAMVLLEAVAAEAAQAVVQAIDVPVIGCGAGPACDGHILVTQDMLGIGTTRPPRFVPRLAELDAQIATAMRRYVDDIVRGSYPGPQHTYGMRTTSESR